MLANVHRLLAAWLLLAGCLAVPALARDEKPNPAAKPTARDRVKFWMDRHEKFVARAKKGPVDVAFLGDSITQGWEGSGKKVWADTFEPLRAANFGIGGDQTGHVLWRITIGKELEPINPKLAVVMIGTNNVPAGHSPEQIAGGIKAIVEELRKQKPHMKVLLLGVFPRAGKRIEKEAPRAAADQLQPKIKQINDIIAKLDDGKMVFYKDIGKKFLDEEGGLPREIMPDYLHLSPRGYQIWADAIKNDVEKLMK
jgi:lysophospholipase L1-like esterase